MVSMSPLAILHQSKRISGDKSVQQGFISRDASRSATVLPIRAKIRRTNDVSQAPKLTG
jgi:hypothetical protein